jgi:hypothetical protein
MSDLLKMERQKDRYTDRQTDWQLSSKSKQPIRISNVNSKSNHYFLSSVRGKFATPIQILNRKYFHVKVHELGKHFHILNIFSRK